MTLRYLSVCSGIEAATVAWEPLGWRPAWFSQIDPDHKGKGADFASLVLAHRFPQVVNRGDMSCFAEWPDDAIDLLVGGTPCQSFSAAGRRRGLDDPRGALMLVYGAIARRYRPKWLVWENVPGVLSQDDGRAFATLLGLLADLGYGVPPPRSVTDRRCDPPSVDPIIQGLLARLPQSGAVWPEADRKLWLDLLAVRDV